MQNRRLILVLFGLWVLAAGWAVWSATGMAPTGDGLVRGFNKIVGFLGGLVVAAATSIALMVAGRRDGLTGSRAWLVRGPAILSLIAGLAVAAAVWKSRTEARKSVPLPDRPVTAPAADISTD